jgi:hypothetical protein
MKNNKWLMLFFLPLILVTAFTVTQPTTGKWTKLFDGKNLQGWDSYIAPDMDSTGKVFTGVPVGLNKDPKHVFTVVKEAGENVIRVSGESWGGISTQKEYENFHFQLKFKWGNLTWGQKKNKKKDSGLLYFAMGPHGADYGAWMRSQEFQLEEGNCGDYWGCAGGMETVKVVRKPDSTFVYSPKGEPITFSAGGKFGRHCLKQTNAENPSGEWNTLDLYCHGDTSVHVVNGKVMMVLFHSSQQEKGQVLPLKKGKLQIQSEGAEVFYKDIQIQHISSIPAQLLQ